MQNSNADGFYKTYVTVPFERAEKIYNDANAQAEKIYVEWQGKLVTALNTNNVSPIWQARILKVFSSIPDIVAVGLAMYGGLIGAVLACGYWAVKGVIILTPILKWAVPPNGNYETFNLAKEEMYKRFWSQVDKLAPALAVCATVAFCGLSILGFFTLNIEALGLMPVYATMGIVSWDRMISQEEKAAQNSAPPPPSNTGTTPLQRTESTQQTTVHNESTQPAQTLSIQGNATLSQTLSNQNISLSTQALSQAVGPFGTNLITDVVFQPHTTEQAYVDPSLLPPATVPLNLQTRPTLTLFTEPGQAMTKKRVADDTSHLTTTATQRKRPNTNKQTQEIRL